ncbi:MAG TPA: DUF1684 domain-containing protein [Vicinamibacterales bacterium]|jgi:hypothetical protein|nr:DUF1684 domain-containing protein [Vicinamibacterales bacterium]
MRLLLPAAVVAALVTGACTSGPSAPVDPQAYAKTIAEARAVKDKAFREEPEPIPADKRDTLLPLRYYPPDPSYTAPAELKLANERPVFEMPTSTGKLRRMERVGVLEFSLRGQPMSLAAFVEEGQALENLFVPFADLTTGKETYPAGRYLDIRPTSTGFYNIDFNMAYNPTCAYNATYDCPYPPASNRLKVEIRAGEKAPGT